MTENWDVYFCQVDEKPASILVDLGCAANAPTAEMPVLGYVSVPLKRPDEHGFPGPEEYDLLGTLEDALDAALSASHAARYVGRCVTDGHVDFFFYLRDGEGWNKTVSGLMESFRAYTFEAGAMADPAWEGYFGFLFPSEHDMLLIQNRRACHRLEEGGDDLARVRFIDHWVEFSSRDAAEVFSASARDLGYFTDDVAQADSSLPDDASQDTAEQNPLSAPARRVPEMPPVIADTPPGPDVVQLRLSRADAPEFIDEITLALFDLAKAHDGHYLGWSCPAVAAQ